MRQFAYVSTAINLPASEIENILTVAQRNNLVREITGALLYNGRNFLQVIEGSEAALLSLMHQLRSDPRHSGVVQLIDRAIDRREFPDWAMQQIGLVEDIARRRERLDAQLPVHVSPDIREMFRNFAMLN